MAYTLEELKRKQASGEIPAGTQIETIAGPNGNLYNPILSSVTKPTPTTVPAAQPTPTYTPQQTATPAASGQTYTVKPGDTLNKIASQYGFGSYKQADITGYRSGDPNKIYPGEVLTIGGKKTTPPTQEKPTDQTGFNQEIQNINTGVNDDAKREAEILAGSQVDLRDSSSILEKLAKNLDIGGENKPKAQSMTELFASKRAELGLEPLETQLSDIDSQLEEIDTNLLVEAEKAGERLVPMGQITRTRGKLQKEAEQRKALLSIQRNSVARRLDNKMSTLQSIMTLTQQDFQNATTEYNSEFSKNLQLINLFKGAESEDKNEAQANLNTMINLASKSGKSWDEMTPSMQQNIASLELQAGIPVGTTKAFMVSKPQAEVLDKNVITDANGNQFTQIIYKDPKTGMAGVTEVVASGVKYYEPDSPGSKQSPEEKQIESFQNDVADYIEKLDTGEIKWRTAWDALHSKYPQAGVELIDSSLGLQRRNN